jgi:hypothetical protein
MSEEQFEQRALEGVSLKEIHECLNKDDQQYAFSYSSVKNWGAKFVIVRNR